MGNFAPTINLDGRTYAPKNYEWILGFAFAGCGWAVREASKPEFLIMVREKLAQEEIERLDNIIDRYKVEIGKLEAIKRERIKQIKI